MDKRGDEHGNKPTKVTLIETRHVKVEARDFKSLVQSLTGVNSSVAWIGDTSSLQKERKRKTWSQPPPQPPHKLTLRDGMSRVVEYDAGRCRGSNNNSNVIDGHGHDNGGLSNVDLDEMLQGLPLMEELDNWSWNENK